MSLPVLLCMMQYLFCYTSCAMCSLGAVKMGTVYITGDLSERQSMAQLNSGMIRSTGNDMIFQRPVGLRIGNAVALRLSVGRSAFL